MRFSYHSIVRFGLYLSRYILVYTSSVWYTTVRDSRCSIPAVRQLETDHTMVWLLSITPKHLCRRQLVLSEAAKTTSIPAVRQLETDHTMVWLLASLSWSRKDNFDSNLQCWIKDFREQPQHKASGPESRTASRQPSCIRFTESVFHRRKAVA